MVSNKYVPFKYGHQWIREKLFRLSHPVTNRIACFDDIFSLLCHHCSNSSSQWGQNLLKTQFYKENLLNHIMYYLSICIMFSYSEKASKIWKYLPFHLTLLGKSKIIRRFFQNFSEYMNLICDFLKYLIPLCELHSHSKRRNR